MNELINGLRYSGTKSAALIVQVDYFRVARHAGGYGLKLRCVTGEDRVACFDGPVAGEAGFMHRLVGRLAVVELSKPPAAGRGVFS